MTWTQAAETIDLLMKRLGLYEELFIVQKVWKREVNIDGVEIAGYKNGVIFTKTLSSVANYELTVRKKEIIKKLNQYIVGSPKIKNIKIKIE
ncbi:hypothetical protein AGMMS49950_03660 [Endomicrobiia bacterium]|nr:hypothetical protein AGMMS49531_04620 [Endomicrobiia bacterium]GHT69910.1 hypothetical protein AGMMS49950_03660 [Endomicrobiia bacterium]